MGECRWGREYSKEIEYKIEIVQIKQQQRITIICKLNKITNNI
jgi:hypothetical protein